MLGHLIPAHIWYQYEVKPA